MHNQDLHFNERSPARPDQSRPEHGEVRWATLGYKATQTFPLNASRDMNIMWCNAKRILSESKQRRARSKRGNYLYICTLDNSINGGKGSARDDNETLLKINFIIKKRKETHLIKQFPFCLPTVMFC